MNVGAFSRPPTRVILVHGFNVRDGGRGSIGKLAPYFTSAGFEVLRFDYGWRGLLGVRFGNEGVAKKLIAITQPGDVIVGHSNGCCVAHLAAHTGARFGPCVYINPALDADARLAPQVPSLDVWFSPSDTPVRFARFLPFHPWGDMGRKGYVGDYDPRIASYNKETDFSVRSDAHSDVFTEPALSFFAPLIVRTLQARLGNPIADPISPERLKRHFANLRK